MSFQVTDTISTSLEQRARAISNRRPILEAMGQQLVSITKRAFNDASLRPSTWAPKKIVNAEGKLVPGPAATLKRKGALWQSIRISDLTNDTVTAGSDRPHAAIHQIGGVIRASGRALRFQVGGHWFMLKSVTMPPRPYFPFLSGRMTPAAREKIQRTGIRKINALLRIK